MDEGSFPCWERHRKLLYGADEKIDRDRMVDTQKEIKALDEELVTMRQLRYKLSNQLRGFK